MSILKQIHISGVLVGFIVVVSTTIVLSIFSPLIFSKLAHSGDKSALLTNTGPLSYAIGVIFISTAFGVFICNKVAQRNKLVNGVLVIALYAAFTYWLSLSPSNRVKPYPDWYVFMNYVMLAPGALAGYSASKRFNKNA